jgi:mono/diheme cytochrome c family protein
MTVRRVGRILVPVLGLLIVLIAVRGWRVARRQYEAPGEGLVGRDSAGAMTLAVAQGRTVYHGGGTCLVCHGRRLEGGIGPTLGPHAWKDAKGGDLTAIYGVVTHGVANTAMVAHPGGISDTQAMQVASYVWAVSHGQAQP